MIIGPFDQNIEMVAESESIPYLITSQHAQQAMGYGEYTYFMLPEKDDIHRAILDVVDAFEWKDNAVIYDSTDGKISEPTLSIFGVLSSLHYFLIIYSRLADCQYKQIIPVKVVLYINPCEFGETEHSSCPRYSLERQSDCGISFVKDSYFRC